MSKGLLFVFLSALTGCGSIEGVWQPGCTAFAGESLTLDAGRYSWDRFTDARRIDAQGRSVDPYPDFPKTGSYRIDGDAIDLLDADGVLLVTFYRHRAGNRPVLLDARQHAAVAAGGEVPDCPLVRQPAVRGD